MHGNCTGCDNQSIQQIFTYLYDKHRDLDEADAERLDEELTEACDPNEPFGTFVSQIENMTETEEAACCPCAPSQAVNTAFSIINKSNSCPEGYREWKREAANEKT